MMTYRESLYYVTVKIADRHVRGKYLLTTRRVYIIVVVLHRDAVTSIVYSSKNHRFYALCACR